MNFMIENGYGYDCLKTIASRTTAFEVDGIENITPSMGDRYLCSVIIEKHRVQHETKDEDVKYIHKYS